MRDALTAVVDLLKDDAAVQALTTNELPGAELNWRVFRHELPRAEVKSMPRACVVVRRISGVAGAGGRLALERGAVDVTCYGETMQAAEELREAVRAALKDAVRRTFNGTLLHGLEPAAAPIAGHDGDARWPFVVETWTFLASEVEVI